MLIELNPKLNDKLAVVRMPVCIMESIINIGTGNAIAVHGVRNIRILDVIFSMVNNEIWLIIQSDDIPAYVAYKKITNNLKYKTIHYDRHGDFNYPDLICKMQARCPCIDEEEEDGHNEDKWWR